MRAVVGARVSILTEGKESQLTQRDKGIRYAESQGWTVVGHVEDLDVSAIKQSPWQRPDLKVWLTDRADDFDALIFAKTDRVFRSASDCVQLAEWCQQHRKFLVLIDDGIRLNFYHDPSEQDVFATAMSRVFLILASVFAEIEGQRFVQRANDRVAQFRHQPRWAYGVPPYGFQVVDRPEGGKALGHDPEAQRVLHQISDLLLSGDSLTRITTRLNDDRTPSPADRLRQRTGKPTRGSRWTISTLRAVLTSAATQGVKTAKGKPVLDASGEPVLVGPASFDPQTWNRIQSEVEQRSRSGRHRRHSVNPLLGVAKCGVCGRNMRHFVRTREGRKTHKYYVCGDSPKPCPGVLVRAGNAERLVESVFLLIHNDRRTVTRVWQPGSDHSAELEQTITTIEALRDDRALGLYVSEDDQAVFRSQMSALIAKRDLLAAQPVVRAGWVQVETDKTYGDVWPDATLEDRRTMLVDAGVTLTVGRGGTLRLNVDVSRALGESSGETGVAEILDAMRDAGIGGAVIADGEINLHGARADSPEEGP